MKEKTTKGMILKSNKQVLPMYGEVTIRAEKTGNLTTLSLADDRAGIMLQVNYNDVKDVIKGL